MNEGSVDEESVNEGQCKRGNVVTGVNERLVHRTLHKFISFTMYRPELEENTDRVNGIQSC